MAEAGESWEAQFVEQLPVIERAIASFGRRYGMSADEIADLSSSIKLRIVEDGYAVFRKFRHESSIATYLTVVVTMFAREYRVQQRGRWRPSAEAQRRGPVAIGLETMVHQKGHTLSEAGAVMRSRGETTMSDRELGELLRELPRRAPLRPVEVSEDALRTAMATEDAAARVSAEEDAAVRGRVQHVLESALDGLPIEDRLLLKLRFWQDASVADAARVLGVEQRPLYRRLERLMNDLRQRLAGAGVTPDQVRDLIGGSA